MKVKHKQKPEHSGDLLALEMIFTGIFYCDKCYILL
jgi:hypothetical protein